MPLRLRPPRPGKTPNYEIRGTYLGVRVERSTGTGRQAVARRILEKTKADIERGAYARKGDLTFADAATSYMRASGVSRFLKPLIQHLGTLPAASIDQAAIDEAAATLYPDAAPATLNRQVYTPVIAILRHAGMSPRVNRPRIRSAPILDWLWPEQARAVIHAAYKSDPEVGCLLVVLLFTGMRRSEVVGLEWSRIRLDEQTAYVGMTKNGLPRPIYLHRRACRALRAHQRAGSSGKVFRWSSYASLYKAIRSAFNAAGLTAPAQPFHIWRHTWATWMRRYGGGDRAMLVASGAWASDKAAAVYDHIIPSDAARLVDRFPMRGISGGKRASG